MSSIDSGKGKTEWDCLIMIAEDVAEIGAVEAAPECEGGRASDASVG